MHERSGSKLKRKALYDAFKESMPDVSSSNRTLYSIYFVPNVLIIFITIILNFIISPWIVYRIVKEYRNNWKF